MAHVHYHPTREELLDILRNDGETEELYESLGNQSDESEEWQFAQMLGYDPTIV